MATKTNTAAPQPTEARSGEPANQPTPPAVDEERIRKEAAGQATTAERQRAEDIKLAVRTAKLDESFADELIRSGQSVDEARKLIIDKWAETTDNKTTDTRSHMRVEAGDLDEVETMRSGVENALLHRFNPREYKLDERGLNFRGMSLIRIAEEVLKGRDLKGMTKSEIAVRALSTSDFPLILANTASKTLRQGYTVRPRTFEPFVKFGTLPDYKEMSRVQFGDVSALAQVLEHGEYSNSDIGENKEAISLLKYGKKVIISEEMIINDDLSAFTNIPMKMGAAAARLESKLVYDVLLNNAAMSDSVALFHGDHGNLGSANAIDETGLAAMIEDMMAQTTLDGADFLEVNPAYLIVGPAKYVEARKILTEVNSVKTSEVNPFHEMMQLIVDSRVTGNKWFVSADPNQVDTIEVAYLDGMNGPEVRTFDKPEDDQVVIRVKHVVGVKALDHRGLYYNPGA